MGQQPNVEMREAERPRVTLETPPAGRWRPLKPGLITAPDQVPRGGSFGLVGPDAGFALKLLARADVPDDPGAKEVLAALMTARAALLGRAPIVEDLDVALILCGYGYDAPPEVVARRERWFESAAHETRPGQGALEDLDVELIVNKPEQVRWALTR